MNTSFKIAFVLFFTITLTATRSFSQDAELDVILSKIDFKKDSVQCIFDWVIGELEYDPSQVILVSAASSYGTSNQNIVREAINRKKGVCQHYAALFNALLKRAGYESYLVEGYTRQGTRDDKDGHVWNAVKLKGKWWFFDPTWASGYVNNFVFTRRFDYSWYKVAPVRFIETHIPFDPIWQCLNPPLTHVQIRNNVFETKMRESFNFQDSIQLALKSNEHDRLKASLARTRSMGIPNSVTEKYLKAGDLYIQNATDYYSLLRAHSVLSNATSAYNEYILSKNHQFRSPRWTDEMLEAFPKKMKMYADSSGAILVALSTTNFQNAQYQSQLKKQLTDFNEAVRKETAFIEKYLATWKPVRMQHFYKK
jgi:hypothetical protein